MGFTFGRAKNANPVSIALLVALAAGPGCSRAPAPAAPPAAAKTVFDRFAIGIGGRTASLHVAVADAEQERGLMQRPDLGPDEGMIFVNRRPRALSFWMRNTPEPLDLAYLSPAGVVVEVYGLLPLDERPVISASSGLQFAVEMPKGWFAAHGVRPGSALDLGALRDALRARGYESRDFGLGASP